MTNWFDQGGGTYARFRPEYPARLATYLASITPNTALAVDVGCGNGQFTRQLAGHFTTVIGLDPSADQLAHATLLPNIEYRCASAEQIPMPDHSAGLVTAAQAAHWFALPRFYAQVRRIARPDAVLALISYGVLRLDGAPNNRFQQFYRNEIGPWWPAERQLVDSGYAGLDFPFTALKPPAMEIRLEWNLAEFLGYIATWSAVRRAREAEQAHILHRFADDIADAWGNPADLRAITWPINMRVGRV